MGVQINSVEWATDLESGIDVMDAQHRNYFRLVNDFLQKASESSSTPRRDLDLAETFKFLRRYAVEHFVTEQEIMERAQYPDFERHEEEHLYFLNHVAELYQQLKTRGYSPQLAREVHYYTIEWFIKHIRSTDKKLVMFLNEESAKDQKLPGFLRRLHGSLFGKKVEISSDN